MGMFRSHARNGNGFQTSGHGGSICEGAHINNQNKVIFEQRAAMLQSETEVVLKPWVFY